MSKVIIPEGLDMKTFISNASTLEVGILETMARELNALITRKKSKTTEYRIAQLYQLINETVLDIDQRVIFNTLNEKLLNETMTKEENRVFLKIAEEEAQLRNKRVKFMIELSQLRGIPFQDLMKEIGLKPLHN